MDNFVSVVTEKLNEFPDLSPVGKITVIVQLRSLFNQCTLQEGFDLIDSIIDIKQMQILVGVGMKGAFYYHLGKRMSEMMEF